MQQRFDRVGKLVLLFTSIPRPLLQTDAGQEIYVDCHGPE